MTIDLSQINREYFEVSQYTTNGEIFYLVKPHHIGCKWTQQNKIFRSSLWSEDGELVSAGLPKFTNWGENPEHFPVPESLDGCSLIDKIDGSSLIVSRWKGKFIIRTRGTVDASLLENGFEIQILKDKYPKVFDTQLDTWDISYIFEWVSPSNIIVLNYGQEPDIYLIGAVNHNHYSLANQEALDLIAQDFGVKRPARYSFDLISEMISAVENLKGVEGLCVYSKNGQVIHKVKSAEYLAKHRFKSNANIETVMDLFIEFGYPNFLEFQAKITETFDYECAAMVLPFVSQISDAYKTVQKIVGGMTTFVSSLKGMTRKEQALKIIAAYGETNRASYCFQLLDEKLINSEGIKKLLFQVLKK